MKFEPIELIDKRNRTIVLRSVGVADAADLIEYLRITATETPFLLREPDEVKMTIGEEERFIQSRIDSERELMLVATINGKHVGSCSLMSVGSNTRYRHRCRVAIALYKEFCGVGIGTLMMRTILDVAKRCGYEQAELEVVSSNTTAIAMYQKLGFVKCGTLPNNMKYVDGSYANADIMVKML